ncbi:MAG TPA: energy transducer TonB, partial [Chitinophagales bacterium]|nr:energy transducer TonB [Chitinophagales bacterium]
MERDNEIEGKVLLRFVVDEQGKVTDVTVVKSVSPGLDAEAVRVVKMLPDFKPGKQQGRLVKVYYNLPIVFKLSDNDDTKVHRLNRRYGDNKLEQKAEQAYSKNNFKDAAKYYAELAGDTKDADAWYLAACLYDHAGQTKNMCSALKKAIAGGYKSIDTALQNKCK